MPHFMFLPGVFSMANGRGEWIMRGLDWDDPARIRSWEELASMRAKRIMDQFTENDELVSFQIKQLAGFSKGGEKDFEGVGTADPVG